MYFAGKMFQKGVSFGINTHLEDFLHSGAFNHWHFLEKSLQLISVYNFQDRGDGCKNGFLTVEGKR